MNNKSKTNNEAVATVYKKEKESVRKRHELNAQLQIEWAIHNAFREFYLNTSQRHVK